MAGPLLGSKTLAVRPDWSRPETHEISFSGNCLSLTIPGRFSKDFPIKPIKSQYNLYDPDLYQEWPGFLVIERWWEYAGRFWQGNYGSLALVVTVTKVESGSGMDIFHLDHLETLISDSLIDQYEARNERKRLRGDHHLAVQFPPSYDRTNINEQEWIRYHIGGYFDKTICASPLTDAHYLEVEFRIIKAETEKLEWYERARRDIERIASSIHLDFAESSAARTPRTPDDHGTHSARDRG